MYPSTRDFRQRQLRDEVKSGGNQPTDIRVIHRRSSAARRLNLPYPRTAKHSPGHPTGLGEEDEDAFGYEVAS